MDARQCREKTQVVGAYDGGARLLEHDLRDPDVVRCRFVAPRQVARVGGRLAPCEQGAAEGGKDVCARPRLYIHRWFSISCWGNTDKGSTDKFGTTILTHLFCPHFGGKSSTEHHSASGFPPRSDEKIYANLADLILSVIP